MRFFATLCILFFIMIDFSMQLPKYENCDKEFIQDGRHNCPCCKVECHPEVVTTTFCSVYLGRPVRYGNNTLVYPHCCPVICESTVPPWCCAVYPWCYHGAVIKGNHTFAYIHIYYKILLLFFNYPPSCSNIPQIRYIILL